MTAHALARLLLSGPDLPVVIGTGPDFEPQEIEGNLNEFDEGVSSFSSPRDCNDASPHVELR